jgi:hypothetical protein
VWLVMFGKTKSSRRCFAIHLDSYVPMTGRGPFHGVTPVSCPS